MSKLTNKQLKEFVEGSYKKKKDTQQIGTYKLDTDLSTRRNKLYYDKDTRKAIHAIAGTDRFTDWFNNLAIPYSLHHHTKRYKRAEDFHRDANTKYGKKNVGLITHSQSGNIAENLTRRHKVGGEDNITLNPAIIGFHNKGLKVVKSMLDPVSLLTITNKRDEVLKPSTYNPITEHSTKILEGTNIINIKNKKHTINNMKEYDSDSESDYSDDGEEISEATLIRDITKLSHDIHMFFQKKKPSSKIIKGMGILVEGIDMGRMIGRGQTGSNTGNKDVDAFNDWSKAIGNKFKPLNKNLSPIKHAMTQGAVKFVKQQTGQSRSKKAQVKDIIMKDIPKAVKIYKKAGIFGKKKGRGIEEGEGLYTSTAANASMGRGLHAGGGLYAAGGAVGRPKKGSPEAIAWGEKMRQARLNK